MLGIDLGHRGLNQIARQANYLESTGNFSGSDRLRILLETHNCCFMCGSKQVYNVLLADWICSSCDAWRGLER